MLISGLSPPCSGSVGTPCGGAAPCLLKSAYMWGQGLGPREALHAWPTGEEGDKKAEPWARD